MRDALDTGSCFSSWEAESGDVFMPAKTVPVAEQEEPADEVSLLKRVNVGNKGDLSYVDRANVLRTASLKWTLPEKKGLLQTVLIAL